LARGQRLIDRPKHLNARYAKDYWLLKSLAEPVASFVIISNHKEIDRWQPPPHPELSTEFSTKFSPVPSPKPQHPF